MKVGIIGGGQLARMLALAGYPLGLRCTVLDPARDACAGQVAPLLVGAYDDKVQLEALAHGADVVTFDFENVPAEAVRMLSTRVPVYPPPLALATAQDRVAEKTLFGALGIPTPAFATVDSREDLRHAIGLIDVPSVLKTRRLGYDGKGQAVLRTLADVEPAWQQLQGVPLVLEEFIPFEREVSVLAARSGTGETVCYPLVENQHQDGILRVSRAPYTDPLLEAQGWDYLQRVLHHLDYVGLLAIEFFVKDGALIANEMAPRVHNSGHWTIEGAVTSQFENHLRAIVGLPLGVTDVVAPSVMHNCIGTMPNRTEILRISGAHYHDYGKAPRAGRKVGHVTVCGAEHETGCPLSLE